MKLTADIRNCLVLSGIVLIACLLCTPYVEMGVNDDWSYIKTAQDLAKTGHLVFNGWAAAMVGAQAYWGALFALIFGKDSFTAVRLSSVPIGMGTVALFYAICRRSGVTPSLSFVGAVTLGLSPMFVPFAVTFMTDIPSLFLFLLSIYAYLRTAEEQAQILENGVNRTRFLGWLLAATVASLASGTVRQIGWLLPVLAESVLFYDLIRSRKSSATTNVLLVSHAVALAVAMGGALWINNWFAHQPYAVHEELGKAISEFIRTGWERFPLWNILPAAVVYTLVLLALPVLPFATGALFPQKRSVSLPVFVGLIVFFIMVQVLFQYLPPRRMFPWIQNTVTETEIWWSLIAGELGHFPVFLNRAQRYVLSYLIVGLTTLLLATSSWNGYTSRRRTEDLPPVSKSPFALRLFQIFTLIYIPLLVIKLFVPYSYGVLDRYVLPLLPGLILWLLRQSNSIQARKLPVVASGAILLLFAYYGIGRTHDCFSQRRAVLAVSNRLLKIGVPRTLIKGGLEYNGWTQITTGTFYNDPRVVYPIGAYHPAPDMGEVPKHDPFWFYTPRVKGVFYIVASPFPDLQDTATPPETYDCWLPPFRRQVFLQTSDARFKTLQLPPL